MSLAWFDSATGRIPPTVLYCWWWCLLSRSESQLSFSWNSIWTTTSLGAKLLMIQWSLAMRLSPQHPTQQQAGHWRKWRIYCTTGKDQITGQAAAAVGRSVALFRSNCTDSSTRTPWVKYTLVREKNSVWPKSGPVKTGPTWPSATPLVCLSVFYVLYFLRYYFFLLFYGPCCLN